MGGAGQKGQGGGERGGGASPAAQYGHTTVDRQRGPTSRQARGCQQGCDGKAGAHLQRGGGELRVAHAAVAGHAAAGDVGVDHVVGAQRGHLKRKGERGGGAGECGVLAGTGGTVG